MRFAGVAMLLLAVAGMRAAEVIDQPVAYVNQDVITAMDLLDGRRWPRPASPRERRERLELLINERLLLQEADRLRVPTDVRELWLRVQAIARKTGLKRTLEEQQEEVERLRREERIRIVEMYYEARCPQVSPAEIAGEYSNDTARFQRPSRRHVWRILVQPTAKEQRQDIKRVLLACFRNAQADPDPQVKAVITEDLRRSLIDAQRGGSEDAELTVLGGVAQAIVAAAPVAPQAATEALLAMARKALADLSGRRSAQEVEALLGAARVQIVAEREPEARRRAFEEQARRLSQDGRQEKGGDYGWVAPGEIGGDYEAQVQKVGAGEVSPVFKAGEASCLLYVGEVEEGRQRGFQEVSSEIRRTLEERRRQAMRQALLDQLHARARIARVEPGRPEPTSGPAGKG